MEQHPFGIDLGSLYLYLILQLELTKLGCHAGIYGEARLVLDN